MIGCWSSGFSPFPSRGVKGMGPAAVISASCPNGLHTQ